jgi:hypothetical protein
MGDVGCWNSVNAKFFDPEKGIMEKINREVGQPTQ